MLGQVRLIVSKFHKNWYSDDVISAYHFYVFAFLRRDRILWQRESLSVTDSVTHSHPFFHLEWIIERKCLLNALFCRCALTRIEGGTSTSSVGAMVIIKLCPDCDLSDNKLVYWNNYRTDCSNLIYITCFWERLPTYSLLLHFVNKIKTALFLFSSVFLSIITIR